MILFLRIFDTSEEGKILHCLNFARISLVVEILHENLRSQNGGHVKISPPYHIFVALQELIRIFISKVV